MGKFSHALSAVIRARKTARAIRHPAGAAMAMWCPRCGAELLRDVTDLTAQQEAVARHGRTCVSRS